MTGARPIADDVDGPDTAGLRVAFYRESNGTPGLQVGGGGDTPLGESSAAPFALTVPTGGRATGQYTYYSRPTDAGGAAGNVASTRKDLVADAPGAPTVMEVRVDAPGLRQTAPPYGLAIPGGPGQLRSLPSADFSGQFYVRFSEPVRVEGLLSPGAPIL